jgi:sulfide:quinone oxidoreductase
MHIKVLNTQISVSDQISTQDLAEIAALGVKILVCNRPDGEAEQQENFAGLKEQAKDFDIEMVHIPFRNGEVSTLHTSRLIELINSGKKIHVYCRTGNRSTMLWASCSQQTGMPIEAILAATKSVGFDSSNCLGVSMQTAKPLLDPLKRNYYEVVIIGAGSGGIAVAASLLKRKSDLRIAVIDSAQQHFYQPGWTMVGAGIFSAESTCRATAKLIPRGVKWIQQRVSDFSSADQMVLLSDGGQVYYGQLIIAPGLKLDWSAIEGLSESLGKNGVTSNYRYDLAPYTWQLVQALKKGKAVFTQAPLPIKCAGAPQKALYLSADHWLSRDRLKNISIDFYNAGNVLFGVETYVPALMSYMEKYKAQLNFNRTLTKVDGEQQRAWFTHIDNSGERQTTETPFDLLHVCPPQIAPDFIRSSELCDEAGWLDVNPHTLQHKRFNNIWGLGDVINTTNAKTVAAARKQAPVVAENVYQAINGKEAAVGYDGYGSCPLTVERGKIVLAEFGYGGKLLPTFPIWLNKGSQATKQAWFLKTQLLPTIYWHGMLKGREWLATPKILSPLI